VLEAEGWSVWWDTSLAVGDDFRNEIMTELGRARGIVIWTDASIKSDWVRSEGGRAQADRKLIPVKLAHLNYKDLPPPFDVLHTENLGEADKVRAAVVAQTGSLSRNSFDLHPWTQSKKPVVRIGPSRYDNECAQKLHVPSNEPSAKNLLRHQYTCSQHPRSKIAVGACGA